MYDKIITTLLAILIIIGGWTLSRTWVLSQNIEMVKAMAIAECMSNNKKNKCYLYAINDQIVWK